MKCPRCTNGTLLNNNCLNCGCEPVDVEAARAHYAADHHGNLRLRKNTIKINARGDRLTLT